MNRPLILRPDAQADVRAIRDELDRIQAGLGQRFFHGLGQLLERIEKTPELYCVVWQDVRAARVKRFRYVIYYVDFADRIEVLAVLHGARDVSAWQSRKTP